MLSYPEYKVPKFTESYIEEKNIISLCLNNIIIYKDIRNIISSYLLNYSTGLSKFIIEEYTINNINYKFKHSINHPIYCILRLLSKYNFTTNTNVEFNQILTNINNTVNYKNIELDICFNYLINKNKKILNHIKKPTSINDLLDFINIHISKLNLSSKFITYSYIENNNYIFNKSICPAYIEIDNNFITLEDLLINKLGKYIKSGNNYYKSLINTSNDVIYFELNRFTFNNNFTLGYDTSILSIPKILNLPPFIFYKNIHIKLELLCVILYHINIKQYSIIIKDNNDYFHIFNNKIILVDDFYFYDIISKYSNILFYKKI